MLILQISSSEKIWHLYIHHRVPECNPDAAFEHNYIISSHRLNFWPLVSVLKSYKVCRDHSRFRAVQKHHRHYRNFCTRQRMACSATKTIVHCHWTSPILPAVGLAGQAACNALPNDECFTSNESPTRTDIDTHATLVGTPSSSGPMGTTSVRRSGHALELVQIKVVAARSSMPQHCKKSDRSEEKNQPTNITARLAQWSRRDVTVRRKVRCQRHNKL